MKVFVAGATGVVGRPTVARLVAAGHEVTGIARTEEKAALLRSLGATPAMVDLFDADAVRDAVARHDAVVNLATHIPPISQMARPGAWDTNNRIRTEGSRILVDAALAAGASVYVQESLAFLYGHHGEEWIDEDTPLFESVHTAPVREAEAQVARFTAAGGRGVALRFGRFVDSSSDQYRAVVKTASMGFFMEPGPDDVYLASIHVDDAASAVVAALEAPAGVYNVVDDRPVTRAEQRRLLGEALGRRLMKPPAFLARFAGPSAAAFSVSQRVSNRRFKDATGWTPRHADTGDSFRAVVRDLGAYRPPLRRAVRDPLLVLLFIGLSVGVQALFTSQMFYDDFPFGRGWVAADGPYNQHLLTDFGSLNLALAVLTIVALVSRHRTVVRATGAAWLVYGLPHFLYHVTHLGPYDTGDAVANVVTLGIAVVLPLLVLLRPVEYRPKVSGRVLPGNDGASSHAPVTSRTS